MFLCSNCVREKHRRRVLGKIFRPKRVGVTEGWRRLHGEERHDLYCSLNIIWGIN
jgi:hypothetical protein